MIGRGKFECRRCVIMADALALFGRRQWAAICLGLLTCITATSAEAADCPGHPDAIGTSRTLVVDPREHPRIGTMQYAETLPLRDHEVVLTFDDGPLPRNSNQILDILASNCVKATFFEIGRMAQAYPEGVRKLVAAGHSVGTHTQNHPLTMNHMPIDRARQEIDGGIASVKSALGDDAALDPFFRIPGLMRAEAVEDYLASQGIQVWSADFLADDWRHISSARVYDLAIKRLEEKGKGILLLHDIHQRTVDALPSILAELKSRGFKIVHVVPATPELSATVTAAADWVWKEAPAAPAAPVFLIADIQEPEGDVLARKSADQLCMLKPPRERVARTRPNKHERMARMAGHHHDEPGTTGSVRSAMRGKGKSSRVAHAENTTSTTSRPDVHAIAR